MHVVVEVLRETSAGRSVIERLKSGQLIGISIRTWASCECNPSPHVSGLTRLFWHYPDPRPFPAHGCLLHILCSPTGHPIDSALAMLTSKSVPWQSPAD